MSASGMWIKESPTPINWDNNWQMIKAKTLIMHPIITFLVFIYLYRKPFFLRILAMPIAHRITAEAVQIINVKR